MPPIVLLPVIFANPDVDLQLISHYGNTGNYIMSILFPLALESTVVALLLKYFGLPIKVTLLPLALINLFSFYVVLHGAIEYVYNKLNYSFRNGAFGLLIIEAIIVAFEFLTIYFALRIYRHYRPNAPYPRIYCLLPIIVIGNAVSFYAAEIWNGKL